MLATEFKPASATSRFAAPARNPMTTIGLEYTKCCSVPLGWTIPNESNSATSVRTLDRSVTRREMTRGIPGQRLVTSTSRTPGRDPLAQRARDDPLRPGLGIQHRAAGGARGDLDPEPTSVENTVDRCPRTDDRLGVWTGPVAVHRRSCRQMRLHERQGGCRTLWDRPAAIRDHARRASDDGACSQPARVRPESRTARSENRSRGRHHAQHQPLSVTHRETPIRGSRPNNPVRPRHSDARVPRLEPSTVTTTPRR